MRNYVQNPILDSMAQRLNSFHAGSFGVGRRDNSSPLVLFGDKKILPVRSIRIALWEQDGSSLIDSDALPDGCRLIFDDAGSSPATCRLALIQEENQSVVALTDEATPIGGYVFITALTTMPDAPVLAINAIFSNGQGHQESNILWHYKPDLVHFLTLQAALLERGCPSNAEKFRPDTLSGMFDYIS